MILRLPIAAVLLSVCVIVPLASATLDARQNLKPKHSRHRVGPLLSKKLHSLARFKSASPRSSRVRRDATSYVQAAYEVDNRLATILKQLEYNIPSAIDSVEADIAEANRDRSILGLANFFGMLFGLAGATGGNPNLGELSDGNRILFTAQLLYGYGYWGPYLLEFEDARLDCGQYELEEVLAEYAFLTNMAANYGYLDSYSGGNARDYLTDVTDPVVLQYYAVELNHAMKRALYCITSKKGGNQQALEVNTLIDLYTQLLSERLAMTNEAINEYANRV